MLDKNFLDKYNRQIKSLFSGMDQALRLIEKQNENIDRLESKIEKLKECKCRKAEIIEEDDFLL